MWLYYALARRLSESKPVLFQTDPDRAHLFTNQGVFKIMLEPLEDTDLADYLPDHTWCLVDLNNVLQTVGTKIARSERFIIQAASPRDERFDWVEKETIRWMHYIMKPMSLAEVLAGWAHYLCNLSSFSRCY